MLQRNISINHFHEGNTRTSGAGQVVLVSTSGSSLGIKLPKGQNALWQIPVAEGSDAE